MLIFLSFPAATNLPGQASVPGLWEPDWVGDLRLCPTAGHRLRELPEIYRLQIRKAPIDKSSLHGQKAV